MSDDVQNHLGGQNGNGGRTADPGVFDMLELSSPLQRTYQAALKNGDLSLAELTEVISDESPEELKIYLNLLAQLNYLEKYMDNNEIRFKVKGRGRGRTSLPDELWKKLED